MAYPGPEPVGPTSSAMELKFWASLMGSAVLMLESGVRVNFQTIFAVAGGAVGLPIFFSRVKPVLSGLPVQSDVFNAAAAR